MQIGTVSGAYRLTPFKGVARTRAAFTTPYVYPPQGISVVQRLFTFVLNRILTIQHPK